jgi:hypothetical protein
MPEKLLFYKNGLWPAICLLFPVCAGAQHVDSLMYRELPLVEVVEEARPSVAREGAPLQRLEREGISRLGIHDLSEAIRHFSGVSLKDYGGIGGLKTVSVRSLGARHTAVSYDGVSVADVQSGQVDISRFSLDHVENLSLSIGQTDDIFQTARLYASAGALRIETQKPRFDSRNFALEGRIRAGSSGLFNPSLRYEQRLGKRYAATLHTDWLRADGRYPYTFANGDIVTRAIRKNSDIRSLRTELNLFAERPEGGKLRLKGYWFDSERGLPGPVILYNDYHTERLGNRNGFIQGAYDRQLHEQLRLRGQAKVDYARTRYRDFHSKYLEGHQTDVYTQREYYASSALLYTPAPPLAFSLATDAFVNTLAATTPLCAYPGRFTSLTALAAQYKDSRLTATVSLLGTFVTEEVKRGKPAPDRQRLSPAAGLSYRLFAEHNLRLRLSYKDIFRIPTFNDLYFDRVGSKNLQPEKAVQYNLGLTWSGSPRPFDRLSLTVDAYYNQVKDKIVAMPAMFIWSMINMGEVAIRGLDVNLSARLPLAARLYLLTDLSYTLQKAIDVTKKESKTYRHQIPYTPEHAGTASVSLEHRWGTISWLLTAVSSRYSLPQNIEANRMDGYVEQQLSLHRRFRLGQGSLRVQAEVVNTGNAQYEVVRYYPMPGRSFRASISYSY